ncbi:cytochrome c oxidase assembly protein [Caulobacter sp.]|jgi:putative membrane protein|uniref:cytochrome c oxidase assembly protein n=1 Tax=Caulobacter sp. TaxID=78 RepID=UPI00161A0D23
MSNTDRLWLPYCGAGPTPAELWTRWNLDPIALALIAGLGAALIAFAPGRRRFAIAAVAALLVIFVSPLCALSSALFSARTVHHVLLTVAAAPLIAWAMPDPRGKPQVAITTLLFTAVFWGWHAPVAYGWAMSNNLVYGLMQAGLLVSAVAAWRAVRAAPPPAAVAGLLGAMVLMGLLGAILTFTPRALYAPHALTTTAWGLTPIADQQLAGLIMWIPAAAVYLVFALSILGRLLRPQPVVQPA